MSRTTLSIVLTSVLAVGCNESAPSARVSPDAVSSPDASLDSDGTATSGDAVSPDLCTTTGRVICDSSPLANVPWGPPVVVTRGVDVPPAVRGGTPVAGVYQLVSRTLYGDPLPDLVTPHVGDSYDALLSVDCDIFTFVYRSSPPPDSGIGPFGGGTSCGRLVPHDVTLAVLVAFTGVGPALDQTPYTATATTLTLIAPALYRDVGDFQVLGVFTAVEEYVLVSAGATPDAGPAGDLSSPNPSALRDPRCPAQPPAFGDACDPRPAPLECEYGGDAFGRCTTYRACVMQHDGSFQFQAEPSPGCDANAPACPASYADGLAAAAADAGICGGPLACNYPEGVCGCGSVSSASAWVCRARSDVRTSGPACPAQRPLIGDGCTGDEQICSYDSPCAPALSLGPALACVNGYWEALNGVTHCPPQGP